MRSCPPDRDYSPRSAAGTSGSYSYDKANEEGWAVYERSDGFLEIERQDAMDVFPTDAAAVAFVQAKADEGSEMHREALAMVIASKINGPEKDT